MKYRIIYNNEEILSILENDNSITYTDNNIIVGELLTVQNMLGNVGINTQKITDFINENYFL